MAKYSEENRLYQLEWRNKNRDKVRLRNNAYMSRNPVRYKALSKVSDKKYYFNKKFIEKHPEGIQKNLELYNKQKLSVLIPKILESLSKEEKKELMKTTSWFVEHLGGTSSE